MAKFLDGIRIRKLDNGFTVRYHIAPVEHSVATLPENMKGETREEYVAGKEALIRRVEKLIDEYIEPTA